MINRCLILSIALLALLPSSCSKPITDGTGSRTDPANPEGIIITIDTTWNNDTIIHF